MKKHSKESILKDYINLCKSLGSLISGGKFLRISLNNSKSTFARYFKNFKELKELALETCPALEDLLSPVTITKEDVLQHRIGKEISIKRKERENLIKKISTLEYVEKFADGVFSGKIKPYKVINKNSTIERALNLTLSDLHFGADITAEETGYLDFGKIEESRRFANVVKQVLEYKDQYRSQTELHINLLGDIIQNKLHDQQDAAAVSEQSCRAIHLLSQGISQLAEGFPKIIVHCATGNHGRDTARHHDRARSGKWDSLETVIYYALKKILAPYTNVKFNIPKTQYVLYEVLGHKVFATHGDGVVSIGNPGKSLNIGRVENQINRINAALKDSEEVKVAIVGHTHCASVSKLSSGTNLLTNGCLCPVDPFAVSIGLLENSAAQILFEMTKKHDLGDIRFIKLSKENDKDKDLDEIIIPWNGLND